MQRLLLPWVVGLLLLCNANAGYSQTLTVANTKISLNLPSGITVSQRDKVTQWIRYTAKAATSLYGQLPLDQFTVNVKFSFNAREPVPWAKVTRSRPPQVTFHLNPDFSLQALIDDWTSVHEFSHLFLPYPGGAGIWFSEGLASYYQNVLMARVGTLSPEQAWQKLYAGFRRGRYDNRMKHLTLGELSPRMWDTASYMRVYWSGAAYFLNVDVALRSRVVNPSSLDLALDEFRVCCIQRQRKWTTAALIRELDKQVGGDIFWREYKKIINSKQFPDISLASQQLGIKKEGRNLVFTKSKVREKIMRLDDI